MKPPKYQVTNHFYDFYIGDYINIAQWLMHISIHICIYMELYEYIQNIICTCIFYMKLHK